MTYLTFSRLERVGRLGNQCHQIASTIGLARRYGYEPRLPSRWSYRRWFSLPDEMYADVHGMESYTLPDLDHIKPDYRIYMQDISLWAGSEAEVRAMCAPSPEALRHLPTLPDNPKLVIHVRRGDNVNQQAHYPLPSLRYYLDAAAEYPDRPVVVFGDDDAWNRQVLAPALEQVGRVAACVTGTPRPKEHEACYMSAPVLDWVDLHAMASCGPGSAFVLSNSTMGWWGAVLSGSRDVIWPTPWYGPALPDIDVSLMMWPRWKERDAT